MSPDQAKQLRDEVRKANKQSRDNRTAKSGT